MGKEVREHFYATPTERCKKVYIVVWELSNEAPTYALWGWKRILVSTIQDIWELTEGIMLTV